MRSLPPSVGGCWPDASQAAMLAALFAPPDRAESALRRWASAVDLDALDPGSERLLPLLHRRMARAGVVHPALDAFRTARRYHWARNTALFARTAGVITALADAGVDTLVLKGVALALRYYDDPGCRPMSDVDLLVPTAQAHRAVALLEARGWRPEFPADEVIGDAYHGVTMVDRDRHQLDVHWHVLHECCQPGADAGFWRRSQPLTVCGVETRALGATDQLLHTVVHGVRWNEIPPLRWVVDAAAVIERAGEDIDWDALVDEVCRRELNLTTLEALRYLRDVARAEVPAGPFARLEAAPVSHGQRRELALKTQPYAASFAAPLEMLWHRHRRMVGGGLLPAIAGFPGFVQRRLRVPRARDIPRKLAALATQHARNVIARPPT